MMRLLSLEGLKTAIRRRRLAVQLRELILACDQAGERELGTKLAEILHQWRKRGGDD
jgi:hypothetical protein